MDIEKAIQANRLIEETMQLQKADGYVFTGDFEIIIKCSRYGHKTALNSLSIKNALAGNIKSRIEEIDQELKDL